MYTLDLSQAKTFYSQKFGEYLTFGPDNQFLLFYGLHGETDGTIYDQHKVQTTPEELKAFELKHFQTEHEKVFIAPCFPDSVARAQRQYEWLHVLDGWNWPTCVETWDNVLHIFGNVCEYWLTDQLHDLETKAANGEITQEDLMDEEQELYGSFFPESDDSEEINLLDYALGTWESEW